MLAERTLTVRGLRARGVDVPMKRPLEVSAGKVTTAPLVLIDVMTDDGVSGSAYIFVYAPWALAPMIPSPQLL